MVDCDGVIVMSLCGCGDVFKWLWSRGYSGHVVVMLCGAAGTGCGTTRGVCFMRRAPQQARSCGRRCGRQQGRAFSPHPPSHTAPLYPYSKSHRTVSLPHSNKMVSLPHSTIATRQLVYPIVP